MFHLHFRQFANTYEYHIELTAGSWVTMDMGIYYGQYDIALSCISHFYREDYTLSSSILVSDIYMPVDMYYIEIKDPDALKINTEI